jgi:hypothetical protein
MQAILFGFGTVLSPPLAASPPFASPLGLRFLLFLALFPVGRDKSLKYPSGGVLELEDILSTVLYQYDRIQFPTYTLRLIIGVVSRGL